MKIAIIGVPSCEGARRLGVDQAPSALRKAGLVGKLETFTTEILDFGDLAYARIKNFKEKPRLRNLPNVLNVCKEVEKTVGTALRDGFFPLVLGGDCSVLIGSLSAVVRKFPNVGLLYMDAHGDFNTPETTPSEYIEGMGLAAVVGRGSEELTHFGSTCPIVREEGIVLLCSRDLDELEKESLKKSRITQLPMMLVRRIGVKAAIRRAIKKCADGIYLHLDVDVMDPKDMPAVDIPAPNGLSYEETMSALKMIGSSNALIGIEITAFNPTVDTHGDAAKRIVELIEATLKAKASEFF